MDRERLEYALRQAISPSAMAQNLLDELDDLVEFLTAEVDRSGVVLDIPDNPDSTQILTLEELEAHSLTGILRPHLADLLDVPVNDTPLVVEDILEAYRAGLPEEEDSEEVSSVSERICELCERPAALTEHHLIPRTEHALMVKRGLFTQKDCQTRIAMLCRPCHSACHRNKSTRDLAVDFNTVEKLLEVPDIARFAEWNSKRKVLAKVVQRRKKR